MRGWGGGGGVFGGLVFAGCYCLRDGTLEWGNGEDYHVRMCDVCMSGCVYP
jgi:hypothetical protein